MTPNPSPGPSRLSVHALLFGTATVNGNDNNPAVNHGHAPPVPVLRNVAHHAQEPLAQGGMDIASESDDEGEHENHGGAGGMKRRQPDTGWDAQSTSEPKLVRREPAVGQAMPAPADANVERDRALLQMEATGQRDEKGRTALMLAAHEGRCAVVRQLLLLPSADSQVAATDNEGWDALMFAARGGHGEVVRQLLALPPGLAVATQNEGWNALMLAAERGHGEVVRQLLALPSADTQAAARNDEGQNALMYAAERGHGEVVRQLLAFSPALAVATDDDGRNALMFAARGGHGEVVWQLLALPSADTQVAARSDKGWHALMFAARGGHGEVVRQLLALSPELAVATDDEGWNALMLAAYRGHGEVVRQLLAFSPELAVETDDEGWNALMLAADRGHGEVVWRLLAVSGSTSAQLQVVNHEGNTAVDLAYRNNADRPVLALLLAAGGRAAQDHDRVLSHAMNLARQGYPAFLWCLPPDEVRPVISWLAQAGVDLHAVDEGGWNALMTACFAGRSDVVEALLREGVQPNAPMPSGAPVVIRDLVQWHWITTATQAGFDAAKSGIVPDAAAIKERLLSGTIAFDGSPNSLPDMGIGHTLSAQLKLSENDKNTLFHALAGAAGLSAAQRSLMQAGLLGSVVSGALQNVTAELSRNLLSTLTRTRLGALIIEQAMQLEEIVAEIEATVLGETLPDLDDFCIAQIAGVDSAILGNDAALATHIAGLDGKLAVRFGLYGVFTQRVRQALVEALQRCRPQLLALLEARYDDTLQSYNAQSWDDADFSESIDVINPDNWLPLPTKLGEVLPQDGAAVATLQQTFKAQLRNKLSAANGGALLRIAPPGASSTVQGLYEYVTSRQLHMLNQFVNS